MPRIDELLDDLPYGPAPEDDSAVRDWLAAHADGFGHFIAGRFTVPARTFDVHEPATGKVIARAASGDAGDVADALRAAHRALGPWSALACDDRARHLYALARHLQKRARFLAVLESIDNGKPLRESRDIDVPLAVRHFYHHAGWAALRDEAFADAVPAGVCGQIVPWNFPLLMLAWKVAPALAAGCTVVLKPAEQTPLSALAFAQIAREAGLPPGVVNIVTGDGATGGALVAAAGQRGGPAKIAFTGSTEVGREIRRATAGRDVALTLELGGKSPFIVTPEADVDAAVEGVVDAIWFNQGEVCCAGSRLLVQEGVSAAFTERLLARMRRLRPGPPLDKCTDIGAIVSPEQHRRIAALVAEAEAEGARAHVGPAAPGPQHFPATLLTGVTPAHAIWQTEVFGPVATLTTWRTPDEAVALANNQVHGLAASIWCENATRAFDLARRVEAGVVWINATNLLDAAAPFGGLRDSGFGREGGRAGMQAYLRQPAAPRRAGWEPALPALSPLPGAEGPAGDAIDRTARHWIGGRQLRPDGGACHGILGPRGRLAGLAPTGNRKDIRNAVEAAHKAKGWAALSGHARAQILYFAAENLAARQDEFVARLRATTGGAPAAAQAEVALTQQLFFRFAALADKIEGRTHDTVAGHLTFSLHEPWGVMGIACPSRPSLSGFAAMVLPAIAAGNRVVALPSQPHPLAAIDLMQVFATSDLPSGVVNLVAGHRDDLAEVLAAHDDVAALWYAGSVEGAGRVELASAGNLKPTWTAPGAQWQALSSEALISRATRLKTVWLPFGS